MFVPITENNQVKHIIQMSFVLKMVTIDIHSFIFVSVLIFVHRYNVRGQTKKIESVHGTTGNI